MRTFVLEEQQQAAKCGGGRTKHSPAVKGDKGTNSKAVQAYRAHLLSFGSELGVLSHWGSHQAGVLGRDPRSYDM